jgi:hypothetical protein
MIHKSASHFIKSFFPAEQKLPLQEFAVLSFIQRQRQNLKIIRDKSFIMAAKAESPYPSFHPSKRRAEKRGRLIRLQRPMEKEALQIAF